VLLRALDKWTDVMENVTNLAQDVPDLEQRAVAAVGGELAVPAHRARAIIFPNKTLDF
jgi:hypothetical protein